MECSIEYLQTGLFLMVGSKHKNEETFFIQIKPAPVTIEEKMKIERMINRFIKFEMDYFISQPLQLPFKLQEAPF